MKKIRIGRSPDLEFSLDDKSVSREHAEIQVANQTITLRDLKSRNGTYVMVEGENVKIDYVKVTSSDSVFFGTAGPFPVSEILFQCRQHTEIFSTDEVARNQKVVGADYRSATVPGKPKKRCRKCGTVVAYHYSSCPECGQPV